MRGSQRSNQGTSDGEDQRSSEAEAMALENEEENFMLTNEGIARAFNMKNWTEVESCKTRISQRIMVEFAAKDAVQVVTDHSACLFRSSDHPLMSKT